MNSGTVRAYHQDGMVALFTPPQHLHTCRMIPAGRWSVAVRGPDGKAGGWVYPLTPHTVQRIIGHFGAACLDEGLRAYLDALDTPTPTLKSLTEPRLYQRNAFSFAYRKPGAMLAMDMGTGKSKVAVDLAGGWGVERVLILCPRSVIPVWPSEFRKHSAVGYHVIPLEAGTVRARIQRAAQALALPYPTVVVVNYEAAIRPEFTQWALAQRWGAVICDESHHIKAPGGVTSKLCDKLRDGAAHRLALTGTPMPHSPLDVYAQFRFLDNTIYGASFVRFRARYAVMGGFEGRQVISYQNEEELNRLFYSGAFRVMKRDVLDLPPVMPTQNRYCYLGPEEMRVYREIEQEYVSELAKGAVTVTNALAKYTRLHQISSGHVGNDDGDVVRLGTAKADALREYLQDLPENEPVVVFCRFAHDLSEVRRVSEEEGRTVREVSGRAHELRAWQDGDGTVLAVQIQAGGEGVDLTRACQQLYYSTSFSLGTYEQSLARLDRPGQTRPVFITHLVARGTIDERIYAALEERKDVVETILNLDLSARRRV
jgi:SNF2 family DNA or RNA helicase